MLTVIQRSNTYCRLFRDQIYIDYSKIKYSYTVYRLFRDQIYEYIKIIQRSNIHRLFRDQIHIRNYSEIKYI